MLCGCGGGAKQTSKDKQGLGAGCGCKGARVRAYLKARFGCWVKVLGSCAMRVYLSKVKVLGLCGAVPVL